NFLRIFSAHGRDHVGIGQCAFEKIYVSEILHFRDREKVPGQPEKRQNLRREKPLISDVVNRKHNSGVAECRIFRELSFQQYWNKRGLPVMAMKNLRDSENLGSLENGATEKREPLGIVRKVA